MLRSQVGLSRHTSSILLGTLSFNITYGHHKEKESLSPTCACKKWSVEIILSKESQKISIGGIKFSEKLTQISLVKKMADDSSVDDLLGLLAQKRINIPFLCHSSTTYPNHRSCFCVSYENFPSVQSLLNFSSFDNSSLFSSVFLHIWSKIYIQFYKITFQLLL